MIEGGDVPDQDVDALVARCRRDLGPESEWFRPSGYPDGLALCIIDSIQSTGSHYTSVVNVVNRYRELRGNSADTDGAAELLVTFDAHGGPERWADAIGNRKPASTKRGAALKSQVMYDVARNLQGEGVDTAADLRAHGERVGGNEERLKRTKKVWTSVEAQSSGVTWEYALMLAGLPGAKADRMVIRFVAEATGRDDLTPTTAASLVNDAALAMNIDATILDHTIWRKASGRLTNEADPTPIEQS